MDTRKFEETIRGAVARGWTSKKNSSKTMDVDLAMAISEEIIKLFTTSQVMQSVDDTLLTRAREQDDMKGFESHIYRKLGQDLGSSLLDHINIDMERDVYLQAFNYKMKIYYIADKLSEESK